MLGNDFNHSPTPLEDTEFQGKRVADHKFENLHANYDCDIEEQRTLK